MSRADDLRRISLFEGLSAQTLEDLSRFCVEQRFDAGQIIILQDDPALSAFFIVQRRGQEGREHSSLRLA